jgi:sugar transferase (PEP-CTERM/EpsH1 system associated)
MLRAIRESADIDLVSLVHDRQEASHAGDLRDLVEHVATLPVSPLHKVARGCRALLVAQPLTHALLDAPGAVRAVAALVADRPPDVVFAYCSGMARFAFEAPLAGLPLVVDLVDVDSAKWHALSASARWPLSAIYAREARLLSRFEALIARTAAATLVVNDRERDALRAIDATADPVVLQNGVDVQHFASPRRPSARPVVVFSGVMNYAPNAHGALWLAQEIWPRVTRKRPDARLVLVGASPGPSLRALATRDPSITVTGTVPSIPEYLWDAAVAVAPLKIARGVQNKVVEAVAAGLPCVITPEVDGGVPSEVRPACHVCDDAASFANAILDLLGQSPGERRSLASRANLAGLDWPTRMKALVPILEAAVADPGRASALRRAARPRAPVDAR